jgi:hypothetical protein
MGQQVGVLSTEATRLVITEMYNGSLGVAYINVPAEVCYTVEFQFIDTYKTRWMLLLTPTQRKSSLRLRRVAPGLPSAQAHR